MFASRRVAVFGLCAALCWAAPGRLSPISPMCRTRRATPSRCVDTDKMETVATIKTGQRPRGIEVSRDGKFVYVALGDDDTIQIFDTKTLNNAGELPSGAGSRAIHARPGRKTLYVANENDAMVTVIDVATRMAIGQIAVGIEPEGMAVSPDFEDPRLHLRDDQHGAFHRHDQS